MVAFVGIGCLFSANSSPEPVTVPYNQGNTAVNNRFFPLIIYIFTLVNSDEKSQVLLCFDVVSKSEFYHTTF